MFVVSSKSPRDPDCLRQIKIAEESDLFAPVWAESVSYDTPCANRFPIAYGVPLKGRHQQDREQSSAKPLRPGVIYNIATTTGATGYGNGRFLVDANGHARNLKYPIADLQENAANQ